MLNKIYLFFIIIAFSLPAYAYIDAGIGSIIVQSIIATILIIPFYYRKLLQKIKDFKKEKK